MSPHLRVAMRWWLGFLVVTVVAVASAGASAQAPDPLAAAKVAAQKAAAEEAKAAKEADARGMARAATGAITEAAQATLARANADLSTAEKLLADRTAAVKTATEQAVAEKDPAKRKTLEDTASKAVDAKAVAERLLGQRYATSKAAAAQLATDKGVSDRALEADQRAQQVFAEKRAATRSANRKVIDETALATKAAADKAAAEKAAAEQAVAEKVAAAKAAADRFAAESDPEKKKVAMEAAAKAAAEKAAAEKATTEKLAAAKTTADAAAAAQAAVNDANMATARETVAQALARKAAAEQTLRQKTAEVQNTTNQAAAAKTAAEKATAERAAAEKAVPAEDAAVKAAYAAATELHVTLRGGLKPLPINAWDYTKARHLLVRAGFGGTPQEVAKLHAMGMHQAVDYIVDFQLQPTPNIPFEVAPPQRADPYKITGAREEAEGNKLQRLRLWWLKRLVESPRPLQEKLTLFWHGHFATQYSVVQHSYTFYQQNQLFRDHAAGNFGGLLYGIVHDPVMLRYLDNNKNVKGQPNENLAREIMELFAMGVDQGYTQADIKEAARALTGYTYDHFTGQFRFVTDQHDAGPKTIFGKTGNWTGDDLVKLILEQPSTARFTAGKLFAYFAYDMPSPDTVDRLAGVLRNNGYELAPMLRNLFMSEEFYSERSLGTQIKSPVQLVIGMCRDLGVRDVADYAALEGAIRGMGQELLEPPDVKGWREGRSWINANRLFVRYNSGADLLRSIAQTNNRRGIDVVALLDGKGLSTAAEVVDLLATTCFVRPLSEQKRKELTEFVADLPPCSQWASQRVQVNERLRALLVLMLSMPEYQMT